MVNHSLVKRVQRLISEYNLLEKRDKILVAVSGGPDSVALLHLLLALREKYELTLVPAHLEHGIRGGESQEQAAFVRRLGEELGLNCIIRHADVPRLHKTTKYSLEEAAREARYHFLREAAYKTGATKIALGHTADDQAETLLMRLLRGAGIEGLAAMRPIRQETPPLIRPLLNIFRQEILDFLEAQNISFCLDSTNRQMCCLRNKIRLQLIPLLCREYNPKILSTLHRTASIMGEKREWMASVVQEKLQQCLHQTAENGLCLSLNSFSAFPLALQREILRQAVQKVSADPYKLNFTKVSLILQWLKQKGPRGDFRLSHTIYFRKQPGELWIERKKPEILSRPKEFCYQMNIPGETGISELNLRLLTNILEISDLRSKFDPEKACLDFDVLTLPLYLRTRRPGDRFQPLGLQGTKKLKSFFIDAKIPREKREQIPLVVSDGRIVWVLGMRIAEPFKITKKTRKILLIEKMT